MSKHDDYLDPDRYFGNNEPKDNELVKEAFSEYEGLGDLYRTTYKYTACGPSVGACIEPGGWMYCDSLYKLGTWEDMDKKGQVILALSVGSIVEGVGYDCDTIEIEVHSFETAEALEAAFDEAVDDVNKQADAIWKETHGCETCEKHWREEGMTTDAYGNELGTGTTPVWDECPDCGGSGTII